MKMMPQCRHQRRIKLSLPRGSDKTPQIDIYPLLRGIKLGCKTRGHVSGWISLPGENDAGIRA